MAKLVGVEQVAKALNVTTRRIQQYADLGMPRAGRGRYNLAECMFWLLRHQQRQLEKRGASPEDIPDSLIAERTRLTKAQADREELDLRHARGELIPITLFEHERQQVYMTFKQRLLGLKRIAPQLEGENRLVIAQKIDTAVRGLLTALASGNGKHTDDDTVPGQPGSPATPGTGQAQD